MNKLRGLSPLVRRCAGYCSGQRHVVRSPHAAVALPRMSVAQYVWEGKEAHADRTALVCAETGQSLTYDRLRRLTSDLARWLHHNVGQDNVLTVFLPNSLEFAMSTLAALEAGVVLSSVNPEFTNEELARLLHLTDTKCVVTRSVDIHTVLEAKSLIQEETGRDFPLTVVTVDDEIRFNGVHFFDDLVRPGGAAYTRRFDPDDTAILLHLNDVTGFPKPVRISHRNIIANCAQMSVPPILPLRRDAQSTVAALLPMFHNYGLTHVLVNGLSHGAKILTLSKFKPKAFLRSVREHGVTVLPTVSSMIGFLASGHVKKEDLRDIENVTIGGAPVPVQDLARLLEILPEKAEVMRVYGLSEGSIVFHQPKGTKKLSSVGQLLSNTEAKVVDTATGAELPARKEGEICVRGPQVMAGYREYESDPDGDWLHTGDVGYYDKDGFFYVTGKIKDALLVNGFHVCPAELEAVLKRHPGVEDAAVFGARDRKQGESAVGAVVPKNPASPPDPKELRNFLAARVARYKRLSALHYVPVIPRLPDGKVDRKHLTLEHEAHKESAEFVALTYI